MTDQTNNVGKVVVVGAGPTGLTLALMLGQRGVEVEVLESLPQIDQRPRGVAYGPPAVQVLKRAGVLDEIRANTFDTREISWRNLKGEYIAHLSGLAEEKHPDRSAIFPVHKLSNLLYEHVVKFPNISVAFSHRVVRVGQDDKKAWVEAEVGDQIKKFEGNFVVGCDGAGSGVRSAIFGEEFPGFTWPQQLIATNGHIDKHKWSDVQWVVHPEDWGVVARLEDNGPEQIWRIGYGEPMGLSLEQLRERLPRKFERILPGSPKSEEYEVLRFSPFTMHQRCVPKMRNGKILLAGDAAHLCNTMGGLGLTGGLSDIGSLVDCFYGILDKETGPDILDKWCEMRRKIYNEYINPISTSNFERILKDPAEVKDSDPFFQILRQAEHDRALAANLQWRELCIGHDMTQYFTTGGA